MSNKKPLIVKDGQLQEITSDDKIDTAVLGSGIADSTKYLAGDNTWKTNTGITQAQAIAISIALG